MGLITHRKARVIAAFDAAKGYDQAADVQRRVAEGLAGRIRALPLPPAPRILEVGCGTGFLTRALAELGPAAVLTVSDIAPAMVARCRESLAERTAPGRFHFLVMDGERPAVTGGFDLVCASLATQWFEDLAGGLKGLAALLRPGGHLAVSTLAARTFQEWRAAHAALGLVPATPDFPGPERLHGLLPGSTWEDQEIAQAYASPQAFLKDLKAIGAHVPAPGARPLGAGALRRVMRRLDGGRDGLRITYHVAYGLCART